MKKKAAARDLNDVRRACLQIGVDRLRLLCLQQAEYIEWLKSSPWLHGDDREPAPKEYDHWERTEPELPPDYGIQINAIRQIVDRSKK